jgi:hypothetical protein
MTLTMTPNRVTIDDDELTGLVATPSLDDWLSLIYGVRPGVRFPRRRPGPVHPDCAATAGWLRAMWGSSV